MQTKNLLLILFTVHCSITLAGCSQQSTSATATKVLTQPLVTLEKPLERLSPEALSALDRSNLFEPLIVLDTTQKNETPDTSQTAGTSETKPPEVDPFENISLNGLFKHGKKGSSVAILKTADDKASIIVSLGESFPSTVDSAIKIKVSDITNNTVVLSSGKQKKVLKIDNLIGFKSSSSSSTNEGSKDSGAAKPTVTPPKAPESSSSTSTSSGIANKF